MDSKTLDKFKNWLQSEKGFSHKSANDTLSRLRRLESISAFSEDDDQYLLSLKTNSAFTSLTVSVKSQLKRAKTLFSEFSKVTPN